MDTKEALKILSNVEGLIMELDEMNISYFKDIKKSEQMVGAQSPLPASMDGQNLKQACCSQPEVSQSPAISPSLMPQRCATPPEICHWAGSPSLRTNFKCLARAVMCRKDGEGIMRRLAILNVADGTDWYWVYGGLGHKFPQGATGRKHRLPKLPAGAKGLKKKWQDGVPADEDVYIPANGVARKLENRPEKGWWFYPRQSALRNGLKLE